MARVTVEDCLKNVRNRFELVVLAAKRARQIMRGKEPKVEWDNDKPTVVALREIAAGFTTMHNVNSTETHEEPVAETFHQHEHEHDEKHHDENHEESIAHPSTPTDEE